MEKRGLVEKEQNAITAYILAEEAKEVDDLGLTKASGADIEINVVDWTDFDVTFGVKVDGVTKYTYKVERSEFNK